MSDTLFDSSSSKFKDADDEAKNHSSQHESTLQKEITTENYGTPPVVNEETTKSASMEKNDKKKRSRRASRNSGNNPAITFDHVPHIHTDHHQLTRPSTESVCSSTSHNSVDAFAERRQQRGRAATAESQASSFMTPRRSFLASENLERGGDKVIDLDGVNSENGVSAEDDVCFPITDESNKPHQIDFEELDRFATIHKHTTDIPYPFGHNPIPVEDENIPGRFHDEVDISEKLTSNQIENNMTTDTEKSLSDKHFGTNKRPINRWSFFSSELEDTIHRPEMCELLTSGQTFRHLFELGPEGGVWWLDMLMPSEEEVETVCKALGIHGLTREDIIQQETREKVELFKSYYFVCFRSFYQMDKKSEHFLEPVNVYAVVFREGIVTITFCPSPHATNVRKRMGKLRDYTSLCADWICYAMIDDIVDSFGPVINLIEKESEAIEDNVFIARTTDLQTILRQIVDCRKMTVLLIRLIGGKADVIKGFSKRCNEQYNIAPRQDIGIYLSDIQDHIVTMMSSLGHFETMLSRSYSNYLAQIQLENMERRNKTNSVLSKVTFVATIFVPLHLIVGMFSVNVPIPGKYTDNLGWWSGILGFVLFFILATAMIAKRMRII